MLLILSFIAIVTACTLLFLEYREYGGWDTSGARPAVSYDPAPPSASIREYASVMEAGAVPAPDARLLG